MTSAGQDTPVAALDPQWLHPHHKGHRAARTALREAFPLVSEDLSLCAGLALSEWNDFSDVSLQEMLNESQENYK